MIITQTERLTIRYIEDKDASFLLDLYNQPAFLKNIGDRGVHDLGSAQEFIKSTRQRYEQFGFWLYLLEEISTGQPVGVNGLLQRDFLDAPDIGFGIDQKHWRKGYAFESSQAIIKHASDFSYERLLAITSPKNANSINLLLKLGFDFSKFDDLEGRGEQVNLYEINLLS
ncbi:GNAT family N-acetyltransferase [Kangiella japonica]|uniref:GNAT family N-acetyltransferase n=1 Tax=Kangiella japonica TaxID=647384 RepID=A0ABN0SYQ8_9GAMM